MQTLFSTHWKLTAGWANQRWKLGRQGPRGRHERQTVVGLVGERVDTMTSSDYGLRRDRNSLGVSGADSDESRCSTDAAKRLKRFAARLGRRVVIAPATARFSQVLPAVAQKLGGCVDACYRHLRQQRRASRPLGNTAADGKPPFGALNIPWLLLVDPGLSTSLARTQAPRYRQVTVNLRKLSKRTTVLGVRQPAADAEQSDLRRFCCL